MSDLVGFIGTGAMGVHMASRLLDAGHRVAVHNRTRSHARALEERGAEWVDTPAELAERCPVVLGCLLDTQAVEHVYTGPDGLFQGAQRGGVLVEHGTFDANLARRLGETAADRGSAFMDAPVSGGPEGAEAGTLVSMVGGTDHAINQTRRYLDAYCANVTHVGDVGAGLQLKLVNQLLVGIHFAAAGEAVALLERLGLDLGVADSVLSQGWAQSAMLSRTIKAVSANRLSDTGATIGGMLEVQSLVSSMLEGQDSQAPVFAAAQNTFSAAAAAGATEADPSALARVAPQPSLVEETA